MNLNLVPTTEQPTAVVAVLRQYGALAANDAIQGIADKHGDSAAALVVAKLPPLAVADIVRAFDYTKQGIVGALLSPRQFREVVERLPLVGGHVADTICGVILLTSESGDRGKYFRELAKTPLGCLALASVFPLAEFVCYKRNGLFTPDGEEVNEHTVTVGDWQELALALRQSSPTTFNKVAEIVISAHTSRPMSNLTEEFGKATREAFGALSDSDDPYAT
jgi:hypothetical protein